MVVGSLALVRCSLVGFRATEYKRAFAVINHPDSAERKQYIRRGRRCEMGRRRRIRSRRTKKGELPHRHSPERRRQVFRCAERVRAGGVDSPSPLPAVNLYQLAPAGTKADRWRRRRRRRVPPVAGVPQTSEPPLAAAASCHFVERPRSPLDGNAPWRLGRAYDGEPRRALTGQPHRIETVGVFR